MNPFDFKTRTAPAKKESTMNENEILVNPFVHRIVMNPEQRRRYLVMSFTLAPFRFFLCLISVFITWTCAFLFTIGMNNSFEKPVHPFRQRLFKVVCRLFSFSAFLLGIKVQVSIFMMIFQLNK